jgi:hypothetical protein
MSLSKICVIAANNSITVDGKEIDYIALASIAAERVKYYLGLDTFILTNDIFAAEKYPIFSKILFAEPTKISQRHVRAGNDLIQYEWKNDLRIDVFQYTYGWADRVLLLDADYMIVSNQLEEWLKIDSHFCIFNKSYNLNSAGMELDDYLPSNDIIQRWATAICYDHSMESKVIFDTAKMVRDNYPFYALMCGMPQHVYRNDLAFSIACHLHNVPTYDNMGLWNLPVNGHVTRLDNSNHWALTIDNETVLWNYDLHIMNKNYAIDTNLMNQLRLNNATA